MIKKSEEKKIKIESFGHVTRITIANAEKHNSFHDTAIDDFVCELRELDARIENKEIRVAIITGDGNRSFCSGYDIDCIDPLQPDNTPLPDARFERVVLALTKMPIPVIAAMNGDAFGGGLDLALSCDFAIAREGVKMAMTPCKLGLVYSESGLARFISRLGSHTTRRLFFTGDVIDANEAKRLKILDEIVPEKKLMTRCMELAQTIAGNAPLAVQGTKQLINELDLTGTISPKLEQLRLSAFRSNDLRSSLEAFKDRRKPTFNGN